MGYVQHEVLVYNTLYNHSSPLYMANMLNFYQPVRSLRSGASTLLLTRNSMQEPLVDNLSNMQVLHCGMLLWESAMYDSTELFQEEYFENLFVFCMIEFLQWIEVKLMVIA